MSVDDSIGKKITREGGNLLDSPTFKELPNGRFQCVETGHELLGGDIESYSGSRRCRLGLFDFALAHQKPPLNMFKQGPLCRSKLICKLTGDTINKSEEHVWKHIKGRRFLNKLEKKEADDEGGDRSISRKESRKRVEVSSRNKKEGEQMVDEIRRQMGDPFGMDSEDRGSSGSESKEESDGNDESSGEYSKESEELSIRTKRMSIEVGPSSFASRKKKSKKSSLA